MTLAHSILRAAHAKGTHHYLALDALRRLRRADAAQWEAVFLKHIGVYLTGSKAPDNEFKDFQNHVLHPRDGFWGGAPAKAVDWYQDVVDALKAQDWPAAAYAAGVLSHYVVDPVMPLHTAQSDAESNVHRAIEWTVSRSYAALKALGETEYGHLRLVANETPTWLATAICQGAEKAVLHYETLLAHYDLARGVVTPEDGFDYIGQRAIAEMVIYASDLFAIVLDRALTEAAVAPPEVSLLGDVAQAVVSMPLSRWKKAKLNAEERRVVEAMYDELKATGKVERTLPADDARVRDLYQAEVVAKRPQALPENVFPFKPRQEPVPQVVPVKRTRPVKAEGIVVPMEPPRPAPARIVAEPVRIRHDILKQLQDEAIALAAEAAEATKAEAAAKGEMAGAVQVPADPVPSTGLQPVVTEAVAVAAASAPAVDDLQSRADAPAVATAAPVAATEAVAAAAAVTPSDEPVDDVPTRIDIDLPAGRTYLAADDAIVDAPSIGPKTAKRFNDVGIDTVDEFLQAHPIALAARLELSHVTGDVVMAWQDQARLVMSVPGLRGTHAQLLVGAGYRTVEALRVVDGVQLAAEVLKFAATTAGLRILRDGRPPDLEKIKGWVEAARAARAA